MLQLKVMQISGTRVGCSQENWILKDIWQSNETQRWIVVYLFYKIKVARRWTSLASKPYKVYTVCTSYKAMLIAEPREECWYWIPLWKIHSFEGQVILLVSSLKQSSHLGYITKESLFGFRLLCKSWEESLQRTLFDCIFAKEVWKEASSLTGTWASWKNPTLQKAFKSGWRNPYCFIIEHCKVLFAGHCGSQGIIFSLRTWLTPTGSILQNHIYIWT